MNVMLLIKYFSTIMQFKRKVECVPHQIFKSDSTVVQYKNKNKNKNKNKTELICVYL